MSARWSCLVVFALASCGAEGDGGDTTPAGFVVPGLADADSLVAGATPDEGVLGSHAACLTRYDFVGNGVADAECTTENVGGDPLHQLTTCPTHPILPLTTEVQWDAAGRKLLETERYPQARSASWSDSYRYDGQGRLVEWTADRNADGTVELVKTFTAFDGAGRPLAATIVGPDLTGANEDDVYPGTGTQDITYGYDTHGRLIAQEQKARLNGALLVATTISYDDVARTRSWEVIVDTSGVIPDGPGPGHNTGYQLFDAAGRIVESHWQQPDDHAWTFVYRYDETGRLLTTTLSFGASGPGDSEAPYVAHEVYDCP